MATDLGGQGDQREAVESGSQGAKPMLRASSGKKGLTKTEGSNAVN
jgi:hypothetical protein